MDPHPPSYGASGCFRLGRLRRAAAVWLVACGAAPASALDWQWGEVVGRLDSFVSVSASMRTEAPDCRLVATINGGCNSDASLATQGFLLNKDDGNLNWDQGDVFSLLFKATHELDLRWRGLGFFARTSIFADAIQLNDTAGDRTRLDRDARYRSSVLEGGVAGAQFQLLDAYLYADLGLADRLFDFRLGNQVLNWGESFFTQGGVNEVNGIDVTRIRLPGTELKEALTPAPILRLAGDIRGPLGFEVYYQFGWRRTQLDPVGSFFAPADLVSRGAQGQFNPVGCGDPGTADREREPFCPPPSVTNLSRFPYGSPFLGTEDARDHGQWGAALRLYLDAIETEFGLYYIRFHDKFPTTSFRGSALGPPSLVDPGPPVRFGLFSGGACAAPNSIPNAGCDLGYFVEFLEDIDLLGASFATVLGGVAIGGEFSYRWGQPTPLDTGAELQALITGNLLSGGPGGVVTGSSREDRIVAILNALYVFSAGTPRIGYLVDLAHASDMTFIAEIGLTSYPNLSRDHASYVTPLGVDAVDASGWGYQLLLRATYDRVFGSAITLIPQLALRHDVHGITPPSSAGYTDDVKVIGVSVEANYQQRWVAILSYRASFGASKRNQDLDRDFAGLSISYAF